ncbi:hypothetical protein ABIA25_004945 [Sinorhizobium fredii]|uniref:hypothetical protein n=1 Tax=Rhizobium fredii TaxID=380 RepID=UPI0035169DD1
MTAESQPPTESLAAPDGNGTPTGYREGKLLPAGDAEDEQGARGSGICPRNRWSRRKVWRNLFEALRSISPDDDFHAIDSNTAKAHRAAAGGIGGA